MIAQVLSFNNQSELIRLLKNIRVDQRGIKIMSPKADFFLIKIPEVPSISANILKQEILSLGGDVAISRDSITGKVKKTDCLLMANLVQLKRLIDKLRMQPFRLNEIGKDLAKVVENYKKYNFLIRCRDYVLDTKKKTLIMGIINVTADSFSGDGLLAKVVNSKNQLENLVLERAEKIMKEGADIIDIGAESSRPGAKPISIAEEKERIVVSLKSLVKRFNIPISIDTYKPDVAKIALDLGASIINDISGLKDEKMRKLIARYNAGAVIMHMKGTPRTMQKNPQYKSLIEEIISFFEQRVNLALEAGISVDNLIIDPGIGFGKTLEHNLEILRRLKEFRVLGLPIMTGVSRKSFIGKILNEPDTDKRIFGTAAAVALSIKDGANIIRVHDIKQMRDAARVSNAIIGVKTNA